MKILITTEPDDTQAIVVKLALEELGHQVRLLFTADFPSKQKNIISIDNDHYAWISQDDYQNDDQNDYDVVWWRRARLPFIPKKIVHPRDRAFVIRETKLFFESLTSNMAPKAWWVNPKESARTANFKLLQLELAKRCGLKIPDTLCTNDPKAIMTFIKDNLETGIIYKPLCVGLWIEKDKAKLIYTTNVGLKDLPSEAMLQAVPGIYQKEVKKSYELRVTCFGDYLVAAKIHSQMHPEGLKDWRAIPKMKEVLIEPYELPQEIQNKIRLLMHQLGIVFGCIDFIVSDQGEYIFLEVNEQGQFLWLEEHNQAFPMLDIFIQFLLSRRVGFQWKEKKLKTSLTSYKEAVHDIYITNVEQHVALNRIKLPG